MLKIYVNVFTVVIIAPTHLHCPNPNLNCIHGGNSAHAPLTVFFVHVQRAAIK